MMILQNLLHSLNIDGINDLLLNVTGLSLDSRSVKPGDLFFAYPGTNADGRTFISQAIQKGAVAVLKEADEFSQGVFWNESVPMIAAYNIAPRVSHIASEFYGHPSKEMLVVGITGTNGKTSSSHLLAQALNLLGKKTGVIGSIGYGLLDHLKKAATLTTPDPITIQSALRNLRSQQVKAVSMEATSHALSQGRLSGVKVNIGIFTNLGRDHFDYHQDQASYAKAKRKLFEMPSMQYGIFNLDDKIGLEWAREFKDHFNVCGFSLNSNNNLFGLPVVFAQNIQCHSDGLEVDIKAPWGHGTFNTKLMGRFNIANLLSVIATLNCLDYSMNDILSVLPKLKPIQGRMQCVGGEGHPIVVIDYAHKPEALQEVLTTLREHCLGTLFCVFGCGGNRDRGKRPIMGKIAEDFADKVIVTSDNLRFENPQDIVKDILAGMSKPFEVEVEIDRAKAIKSAMSQATANDVILLAGKGHETYQIIGNDCLPFDEEAIVKEFLAELSDG